MLSDRKIDVQFRVARNYFFLLDKHQTGAEIAQCNSAGVRAGWSGVRVLAGAGNFSLHHFIQAGSVVHPASYPMGTGGAFPGGKSGRDVKLTTHPI
jgi:hypothetical protein